MFTAYQKIKADLVSLKTPVDMQYIKYYQTNFKYSDFYADKIYQVDIKSCYANILLNNFLISPESFKYLTGLNKEDRLAAVGMLASRKNIFHFDNTGKVCQHEVVTNEFSDYFFYCVQETYKIMEQVKIEIGENFLFSWVDAIYFVGGLKQAAKIQNYLLSNFSLQSTFNELTEFEVQLKGDYYRLRYKKDGKATFMNIPTPSQHEKEEIINYLMNLKREGNNIVNKMSKL